MRARADGLRRSQTAPVRFFGLPPRKSCVGRLSSLLYSRATNASPLQLGRRPVFVVTLLVFALFQIGDALAQNFATVIVIRFLAAVFASSPLTNAGGVISDIWDPINRGKAMAVFSASVFLVRPLLAPPRGVALSLTHLSQGPVIGPIIGGFTVDSYLRWRYVYLFIGVWGAASWVIVRRLLPCFPSRLRATRS